MTKKSDAPAIRFKGFSDAWEQRKLSEIADKVTEKNVGLQYVETFTNSAEFGIISQRDFFDHDIAKLGSLDGYYIVKNEDFVYNPRISTSAPVGPINRNKLGRTGVMSPLYTVFRPHDIDTTYLEHFFKCGYWHSFMNFNGDSGARSDRFSIKDNVFFQMPIPIPHIDEQRKIGELLTRLDHLITLHQRKYEKLTNVKKSMLEKMFPQNGSSFPEIRFKGFTDAWEQRKLGELISEYKETVDSSCTLPVLTSSKTEGVILQEEHFGRKQQHDITGYNVLPRSYCTYRNRSDGVDFTFNVNECCDMGIISKFYPIFCGNNNDTYFLSLVLNNSDEVVHEIAYTCTGTGQKVLSFLDLQKMSIRVPRQEEQKKTSAFFKQLDNLITLHQRKLEKLQNIKKSMLEKMFV